MDSLTDQLKAELTQCAICLGDLRDPRCLPCLHSFCQRCLQSSLQVFGQSLDPQRVAFQCPSCRKKTRVPPEGVKGFPRDFKANKIAEFLENSAAYQDRPKCQVCKNYTQDVKVFCCSCKKHYCSDCEKKFHNLSVFDDHVTIQMGLLVRNQGSQKCETHINESISLYCKTCEIGLCLFCLCTQHSSHEIIEIEQEELGEAHMYSDQLYELQNLSLDLKKNLTSLSSRLSQVKLNHIHVTDQIKAHSEKLTDIIAENERQLLGEADYVLMNATRKLLDDKDQKERLLLNSENLLSNIYSTMMYGNKQNVIDEVKQLKKQLTSIREECEGYGDIATNHNSLCLEFKPDDKLKVGALLKRIEQKTNFNAGMPELNAINIDYEENTTDILPDIIEDCPTSVNDQSGTEEVMNVIDKNTSSPKQPVYSQSRKCGKNQASIKSKATIGDRTTAPHSDQSDGSPNKQKLEVSYLHDHLKHLKGEYSQNNRSIKTFNKAKSLSRTTNQASHKLYARLVKVLDQRGKGQGELMNPSSACFDKDGDIIVGELGNRRLQKFDINGNFKQIIGEDHITPKCVIAMDNNYAIVDEITKSITVLDNSEGSIQTIPCKVSFPSSLGLSSDNTFIVSDVVFDTISRISSDGQIISEYKYHGNSLNDLDNPSDLHICKNSTIFVTDTGNHQIKFLDKDLNLMYKFGSYGRENGQFRYPKGITGNKDYLFISDSGNNRVVAFTHSGKYIGCLLDKDSGIHNPSGICYHDNTNTLCLILPDCDEVRIYKIELPCDEKI